MLHGLTEIALLPSDPGSVTDIGVILDDHQPRRIRYGPTGEETRLYHPANDYDVNSPEGYVRALIRSNNGCDHARLLEVTATADGVSYYVVAERPDCDLDEFVVSDDLSTVALLWNIDGRSELQILEYTDNTLIEPIPLPDMVASELSISAGGSMVAMTVEGPSLPQTVELVDPRSREWQRIDREPSRGPVVAGPGGPTLETITGRDGLTFPAWLHRPPAGASTDRSVGVSARRTRGPVAARLQRVLPRPAQRWNHGADTECARLRRTRPQLHACRRQGEAVRRDRRRRRVRALPRRHRAGRPRTASRARGWSYGGYLTLAALTFHPALFAAGISICGMSDLRTFYRNTEPWIAAAAYPKYGHPVGDRELLEQLSPLRPGRRADRAAAGGTRCQRHQCARSVSPSRSSRRCSKPGRPVRFLLFDDDGHDIVKQENRAVLTADDRRVAGARVLRRSRSRS